MPECTISLEAIAEALDCTIDDAEAELDRIFELSMDSEYDIVVS